MTRRRATSTFAVLATLAALVALVAPGNAADPPGGICTTVPAGALHVAVSGSDGSGTGTASQPFRTIQHAVDRAGDGATIVVHGGDYRESVIVRDKRLSLLGAPGETAWITGSDTITAWQPSGGRWRSTSAVAAGLDQQSRFASAGMIADEPLAGHLAMVFVDGVELRQVGSTGEVGTDTFHVDDSGHVTIGVQPSGRRVDVARRSTGLVLDDASDSRIEGLGFRHHATDYDERGAVRLDEGTHRVSVRQSVFVDNANVGLQVLGDDVVLQHNEFRSNGRMGVNAHHADRLLVSDNLFTDNNDAGFAQTAAAAGIKITASRHTRIEHNLGVGNHSDAIWVDVSSYDTEIIANRTEHNDRYGIHLEVSAEALIASNASVDDERGVQVGESNQVRIWNNVVISPGSNGIAVLDGSRDAAAGIGSGGFDLPYDNRFGHQPGITWNVDDIEVHNNVIADGADSSAMLFVHDPTEVRSAFSMNVRADHNLFHRTDAGTPRWVVGWGDGASMNALETVDGWRALMAGRGLSNGTGAVATTGALTAVRDAGGGDLRVRPGGPADGAGRSVDAAVAGAVGGGGTDIGLLVDPAPAAGLSCTVGGGSPTGFVDVERFSFYEEAVGWLVATGATAGTTPTTFEPHRTATRAELGTILWRLAGHPATPDGPTFDDVERHSFYEDAVQWLAATGATAGTTPTTFEPHRTATRAELATILWRLDRSGDLDPIVG